MYSTEVRAANTERLFRLLTRGTESKAVPKRPYDLDQVLELVKEIGGADALDTSSVVTAVSLARRKRHAGLALLAFADWQVRSVDDPLRLPQVRAFVDVLMRSGAAKRLYQSVPLVACVTPLYYALARGNYPLAQVLLELPPSVCALDVDREGDPRGYHALHLLASSFEDMPLHILTQRLALLRAVLERLTNPNVVTASDDRSTALHLAMAGRRPEFVAALFAERGPELDLTLLDARKRRAADCSALPLMQAAFAKAVKRLDEWRAGVTAQLDGLLDGLTPAAGIVLGYLCVR